MAYGMFIAKIFPQGNLRIKGRRERIMKSKTVLILAIMLGVFAYSLPLYAASKEYRLKEKTVIDIPVVGKITTKTTTYLSGCKLKESTTLKMHNALVQLVSESDGKIHDTELSNLCDEIQWQYDEETDSFKSFSFEEVRNQSADDELDPNIHIDMESDQNDIDEMPKMVREILGYEKNINGFKARKVVTRVQPDDSDNRVVVEEYYTNNSKALSKITKAREDLSMKLGHEEKYLEGVPTLVEVIYESIKKNEDWSRPDGEIVRFVIRLLDEDDDDIFTMKYDVLLAETANFQEDHFALTQVIAE